MSQVIYPNKYNESDRELPVDIGELTEAESISTRGIRIAVHDNTSVMWGHLEEFADLLVQLKVGDVAPVLGRPLVCQLGRLKQKKEEIIGEYFKQTA